MEIRQIKFENYRNLTGVELDFNSISYIIGENGIGKSNILHALNRIFSNNKFLENDFFDKTKKIEIGLILSLAESEIGAFDDYTDPSNSLYINLRIEQEWDDLAFHLYHVESNDELNIKFLRNIQFIYYDSIRNPKNELVFDKEKGSGSLLNFIVKYYLNENKEEDINYINSEKLNGALDFINNKMQKIATIERNKVKVSFDSDDVSFLNSIFKLYDSKSIELKSSGYGIQFSLSVILSLFEKMISASTSAKKRGEILKEYNCVLAFDEPEIHLHPFAQRSLVKDLIKISKGQDAGFNDMINELFGIEKFSAQLLLVSHSDKIIVGNYENIVRVYHENSSVKSISGAKIKQQNLSYISKYENHLQKVFPYFCEALFARCVIFVEGDTEMGAFGEFAKKLKVDFDEKGVSLINANGGGSIIPLIKLFSLFKIVVIGIKDRDVYEREKLKGTDQSEENSLIAENKLILTDDQNFEFEMVNASNDLNELYRVLEKMDSRFVEPIQKSKIDKFKKDFPTMGFQGDGPLSWREEASLLEKKVYLINVLSQMKTVVNGANIAENIPINDIPKIYAELIKSL